MKKISIYSLVVFIVMLILSPSVIGSNHLKIIVKKPIKKVEKMQVYKKKAKVSNHQPCSFTLSSGYQSFQDAGGDGSVQVNGPQDCFWEVSNQPLWIIIKPVSGYWYTNDNTATSIGSLNVADDSTKLTPLATNNISLALGFPCGASSLSGKTDAVIPIINGSFLFNAENGYVNGTFNSPTKLQGAYFNNSSCTASGDWQTHKVGSGILNFTVTNNSSFNSRISTISIANQQFSIQQSGQKILNTILTLLVRPKVVKVGSSVIIKGGISDINGMTVVGKKVSLQAKVLKITKKKVKGKIKLTKKWVWKTIAKVTTNSQGVFAKNLKPKNTISYRAVFGKDVGYNAANSKTVKVVVKK